MAGVSHNTACPTATLKPKERIQTMEVTLSVYWHLGLIGSNDFP